MPRRSQTVRDRHIRLVIWICLICACVFVYVCFHPMTIRNDSRLSPGAPVTLDATSDFLIVVDYDAFVQSPKSFGEMVFSLAWLNTFQQEVGPVSHIDAASFLETDLSRYNCIILTRSVAGQGSWAPKVRSFLERGGTAVMEMPKDQLRAIASADGKGGIRTPQNVTYVKDLGNTWMEPLGALDLSSMTQLVGSAGPLDDSQTYMTIDGIPVIYSKSYATGKVITLDFDYGMLITSLQQGRPLDNFTIRNMRETRQIETSDLAQVDQLSIPLADILERYLLFAVINDALPVTGFWPFFDGMEGALIVSQREGGSGDAALWMSNYESTFKATSTIFARSPLRITDEGIDRVQQNHGELGLEFELNTAEMPHAREPVGPFKFSPVWRQYNIDEQTSVFKARLDSHTPLLSSQSRDGLWTPHYTRAFQMLSASGFRADASYRAPMDDPGYAFATGLPFMPIDTNGQVFNILEFPVLFPSLKTNEEAAILESLLKESASQHHEAIGVSFDTNLFSLNPDVDGFVVWQSIYQSATTHKHWIASIQNFLRFTRARINAELKSSYSGNSSGGHRKSSQLVINTLAPESGMTLTVPRTFADLNFVEARRCVQRAREDCVLTDTIQTRTVTLFGIERQLIPLSKGYNAVGVIYE